MVLTLTERDFSQKIGWAVPGSYAHTPYTTGIVLAEPVKLSEWYELPSPPAPKITAWGEPKSAYEIAPSEESESTGIAVVEVYIPRLEWSVKSHPVLTNQVRALLQTLWAIVVSRATQLRFPIRKTIVSIFKDPTEEETKAVLRLTCNANVTQALAFWDSLEPDLQDWLQTLSDPERTIFLTNIALRVYWQQ